MWQLTENRIALKENLIRRGMEIENGGLCDSCGLHVESSSHLSLCCAKSWCFWCETLKREGILWCIPGSFKSLLEEWPFLRISSDKVIWELIPCSVSWSIWLARNDVVFNQKEFVFDAIWDIHLLRIMWWIKAWWKECPYSVTNSPRKKLCLVCPEVKRNWRGFEKTKQ